MRQDNIASVENNKKSKLSNDFDQDMNDNESISSVSDDEFDQYLGKFHFQLIKIQLKTYMYI